MTVKIVINMPYTDENFNYGGLMTKIDKFLVENDCTFELYREG